MPFPLPASCLIPFLAQPRVLGAQLFDLRVWRHSTFHIKSHDGPLLIRVGEEVGHQFYAEIFRTHIGRLLDGTLLRNALSLPERSSLGREDRNVCHCVRIWHDGPLM